MIDYKITNFRLGSTGITAKVQIYSGDITTEPEATLTGTQDVTRYRRTALLKTIDISLDPAEVVALFTRYVNKRLLQEAQQRGQTVITEQSSTTV
jgi:hypothetical protein